MQQIKSIFFSFLESVEQVSGFKGGLIVNKKGSVVADCFKDRSQVEQIAAVTFETLTYTAEFTQKGRTGQFKNILLEGAFSKVYIMALHSSGYYAAISGTKGMNVAMIRAVFEELTSEIN